jgi:hypothetical protein
MGQSDILIYNRGISICFEYRIRNMLYITLRNTSCTLRDFSTAGNVSSIPEHQIRPLGVGIYIIYVSQRVSGISKPRLYEVVVSLSHPARLRPSAAERRENPHFSHVYA